MKTGIFYGISVGPGDPELLTRKAVRIMEECKVIATPQTKGENTLALDIASAAVDMSGKTILPIRFLMTKDKEALRKSHEEAADEIAAWLDKGEDVGMLNLGDVSIYSTFSYIHEILKSRGYETVVIPGVPSFCAVAAELNMGLTEMGKPLHIIPASHEGLAESLALSGSKILMKTGKSMPAVKQALKDAGLYEKASLVQNCGLPDEKVCHSLDEADEDPSYFTTILVKA